MTWKDGEHGPALERDGLALEVAPFEHPDGDKWRVFKLREDGAPIGVGPLWDTPEAAKGFAEEIANQKARADARGRERISTGMNTPWGVPDHVEQWDDGVFVVETPQKSGVKLDETKADAVPEELRRYGRSGTEYGQSGAFYEGDVAWAGVALGLPGLFSDDQLRGANDAVRYDCPEACAEMFGTAMSPTDGPADSHRARPGP